MAAEKDDGLRRLSDTITGLAEQVDEQREVRKRSLAKSGYTVEHLAELEQEEDDIRRERKHQSRLQPLRGHRHQSIIESAQMSLFDGARRGHYEKLTLQPSNEFPSMLARLPIFVPGRRTNQRSLIDPNDNSMPFQTPWGAGKKHGPPLTVADEDTLMALGMLRQNRLEGRGSRFPISVSDVLGKGSDSSVHVLFTTISEIEAQFGNKKSGHAYKLRLESIKRLAGTRIEFETLSDKAIVKGTMISILDVAWQRWEQEAVLYIQFSPVMAHWYENSYSYVDWNVRMTLPPTGKAIHRFLSSQPKSYQIFTEKLRATVGYPRAPKYFLRELREALGLLENVDWLKSYTIEGNGRAKPHKLTIKR